MSRISKSHVVGLFEHLVKALGGHIATSYNDVDGYQLDYNPVYGGYNIVQIANEGGGQSQPFGSERHGASEMWYMMRFALRAIEVAQKPHSRVRHHKAGSFRRQSRRASR